mgnify:CR=1 FL=1
MPINTDLNTAPYFDDFDVENQYYRVLFKPGYAVQARELTQLQSMLQSQIEQFGDNIFKEGSIIKGCNFTQISDLQFVKLTNNDSNGNSFDPTVYVSERKVEEIAGQEVEIDYVYEIEGSTTGLKAQVISASRGFTSRAPELNTFFIRYLNSNETSNYKVFQNGETLTVNLYKYKVSAVDPLVDSDLGIVQISVPAASIDANATGASYGIKASPGVVFQKGHFLYADDQTLVVSKYTNQPDNVSVGYRVQEGLISALQDADLYDNANGSNNENAPGADRLRLIPTLTVLGTAAADTDPTFFTLIRYQAGNEVTLRDVSQYNVLGEELARRTYEESGNYILNDFKVKTDDRLVGSNNEVHALLGSGTAYVKGYRIENNGERPFVIDQIETTEIQENQPVSFSYGGYVDVLSYNGYGFMDPNEPLDLLDNGDTKIGEAFVLNVMPNKAYLTGVRMDTGKGFSDVIKIDGSNGEMVVANTTVSATLKDNNKAPLVFDTGLLSVKETTDTIVPVRTELVATHTSNQITISASPGEDFAVDNSDIVVLDSTGTFINVTSVTTTLNDSQLNISLNPADGATTNLTVYFNKRLQNIEPHSKIVHEPYVKVVHSNSKDKYSLGFPDVFEIQSIEDSAGTDFTDSFRLVTNQKDQYYDLSYMEYITGRPRPAGTLTIQLKVFEVNVNTGEYYFSINSYPNTLDTSDIPVYTGSNGVRYNLRECLDFRPHVVKDSNVDYTDTTPASAGTVSANVDVTPPSFIGNGLGLIPAINTSVTTDIEYYLSRVDVITVDSYGEIKLIKGEEERFATPPKVDSDKLVVAEVTIPGYPALSRAAAAVQKKSEYAVKAKSIGIKNFTMKDIHNMEKRIDTLAYYTSLNQLETETQNLTILDEDGLSRFKNGFLVDPFNNLSLSNVENAKFNAAVQFNQKILTPSLKTFPLDLEYKSSTGTSLFSAENPKVATLGRNADISILNQPYASEFRNCVSNFYQYNGVGALSPEYDAAYDTTTNPVTLDIDLESPFEDFVDNIQSFLPLTDTSVIADRSIERIGRRRGFSTTTLTSTTTELTSATRTSNEFVGDFVTNFQFNPFMSSREVKVYMSGLRPNTRHYFFFDEINVDAHVIPGSAVNKVEDVQRFGSFGDAVETDSNGVLRAVFKIPAETFYVGDRVLEVVDVDQYASIESASTSYGFKTYRAYNFSVERSSLTAATRTPDFEISSTTTTRNLPRRPVVFGDPLAQTFFIKNGMGRGSNSVFISKVDLFFKRKSDVNGVTVMLREVVNGYPSDQVIPFSKIHYTPSQVNVSDDASSATTFTFEAPIRLDVEKEYSVVVQPDANDPNYLIYTSKVGGTDLTPGATQGQAIVQDWGDGVLFTSTNNRAWKSYQDEDVKFNLYRHDFNESSGTLTLTTKKQEFLSVDDITGRFNVGETVYQVKSLVSPTSQTISIAQGTSIITGTDLDATYSVGDYILVQTSSNTNKDIFKVVSVDSTSQITVNKPAAVGISNGKGDPIVVGTLSYYDKRTPNEMHLQDSSAKTGRRFDASFDIVGFDSESTANLASVDNIQLSYIQPMILKSNDSVSTTTLTGEFVSPSDVNSSYTTAMKFSDNNYFNNKGAVLYSKSNDLADAKPFELNVNMTNGGNSTSTPFVDVEVSKLIAYQYRITNDADTTSSYISKTIELAEDFDAEDINVILTGYRPVNTDIKVYIKPQNTFDSDNFDAIDWIELELFEGVGVYSSTSNINDYREFNYRVADSDKDSNGALTYISNAGTFSGYRKFAIRIDLLSDNLYNAPTLKDYRGIALT